MSPSWTGGHHALLAAALALLLTVAISLTAGTTPPSSDSLHYVNVATQGLVDNPNLAAPYAYRFGTPLIVRWIHQGTPLGIPESFQLVAFLSAWGVLVMSYLLARSMGGQTPTGLGVMAVVAFSFFNVKFPLAVPSMVDVQGLFFITLALWFLARQRFGQALLATCAGVFFKEFLLIPGALIIFEKLREYRRTRETAPLVWVIATLCLVTICFILPRVVIPVAAGYGANSRWDFATPDRWAYVEHLRFFLSGKPDAGRMINIVFAMSSYWLPVLLLATPERLRKVWEGLSTLRLLCAAYLGLVVFLALFGGTNIMIFVAYSLPIMAIVLVRLFGTVVHPAEIILMFIILLIFNRIPLFVGGPASTIDDIVRFYGGWWSRVDMVTLSRTLEMCGYLLLLWSFRFLTRRLFIPR